jgi:hypothetical protein
VKLPRHQGHWLQFNYIDETGEHAIMSLPINGLNCFEDTAQERVAIVEAYRKRDQRERKALGRRGAVGRVVVELHTIERRPDRAMLMIRLPDEGRSMVGIATLQLGQVFDLVSA